MNVGVWERSTAIYPQKSPRKRLPYIYMLARYACRSMKDSQGREYGVAGSVEELAQASLSSQPLSAFDWCPERAGLFCCGALDQTLRVGLVTGLPA